jgi:hypothetical protein
MGLLLVMTALPATGCALMKNRRLRNHGVSAPAVILSVDGTNTRVNEEPVLQFELEVEGEDGAPFYAIARQVVPVHQIPDLRPGDSVTVHYDPANPSRAVIVALGHAPDESAAHRLVAESEAIRAHLEQPGVGVRAMGIVISYEDLQVTVNEVGNLIELGVKVLPEGQPPFDAIVVAGILHGREHKYAPGSELQLLYDPTDRTKVHFDPNHGPDCVSHGPGHVHCAEE